MDTGTDGSTVGLSGHVTDSISFTFLGGETSRDSSAANGLSSGKKKKNAFQRGFKESAVGR